jgi:hypothetical protein
MGGPAIAYLPPAMSQKPVSICEKSVYAQTTNTIAWAATHPRGMDEDFDQLVDAFRRLVHRMLLDQRYHGNYQCLNVITAPRIDHTSTCSHSLRVVLGNIVLDPCEIRIRFLRRVCCLQLLQSTSDHAVSEQTWKQSDLQREPILRLPDVEDVAAVCRASCQGLVWIAEFDMCGGW